MRNEHRAIKTSIRGVKVMIMGLFIMINAILGPQAETAIQMTFYCIGVGIILLGLMMDDDV
jgi:hypothetical protein